MTSRLETYQPYWAARAELLSRFPDRRGDETSRAGARGADAPASVEDQGANVCTVALNDARRAYDIAIGLERDPAVRNFLLARQRQLE